MKNLKEFKELIERYETIKLKEIEKAYNDDPYEPKNKLTGFGSRFTCKLCKAVTSCNECVYGKAFGCIDMNTYQMISNAQTPEELLTAYRNRAKFMRKLLKEKINALKGGEK